MANGTYITSDSAKGQQGLINIVGYWVNRYRMIFGPSKMRITVSGPACDMDFFQDTESGPLMVTRFL